MSENLQSGSNLVLAADLGGTHLRVALVNDHGEILAHVKRPTPRDDNPEVIVNALIDGARECGANDRFAGLVRSASITVPGAVDMKSAVVVQAPNLPSLKNFALKDAWRKSSVSVFFLRTMRMLLPSARCGWVPLAVTEVL